MRYLLIIASALMLGSCATTTDLVNNQREVVQPAAVMYKCGMTNFPNPNTLTDKQVAQLLEQMYRTNVQCRHSLNAIRSYLAKAAASVKNGTATPAQRNMLMYYGRYNRRHLSSIVFARR